MPSAPSHTLGTINTTHQPPIIYTSSPHLAHPLLKFLKKRANLLFS